MYKVLCINKIYPEADTIGKCKHCGGDVLEYLVTQKMRSVIPDSSLWDWWCCCSNPSCPNHYGSGYFKVYPTWVRR